MLLSWRVSWSSWGWIRLTMSTLASLQTFVTMLNWMFFTVASLEMNSLMRANAPMLSDWNIALPFLHSIIVYDICMHRWSLWYQWTWNGNWCKIKAINYKYLTWNLTWDSFVKLKIENLLLSVFKIYFGQK